MTDRISPGDVAPDFDLSSTEAALIMLRDEVPRTSVVLYVFADPESDAVRRDLQTLAKQLGTLAGAHAKVLAMAPLKMPVLSALQAELDLAFPLLSDDRDFLAQYGVEAAEGETPAPALFLINRRQVVAWAANPVPSIEAALGEIAPLLKAEGSSAGNYPKAVINRLVDRWVN